MLSGLIWPDLPGVSVDATALVPLSIILVGTCRCLSGRVLSGFRLTKCVGLIFFSFYFIFVAYDLLHDSRHDSVLRRSQQMDVVR